MISYWLRMVNQPLLTVLVISYNDQVTEPFLIVVAILDFHPVELTLMVIMAMNSAVLSTLVTFRGRV